MHTEGEIAGASAAGAAGIPFCLSTLGTTSIEGVKAANPAGRNWFQLYVMRDREISYGLTRRAAAAGFDTLLFTVDAPVAGATAAVGWGVDIAYSCARAFATMSWLLAISGSTAAVTGAISGWSRRTVRSLSPTTSSS